MVAERFGGEPGATSPLRGPALDIRGLIHVHRTGSGSAMTSVAALRGLDLRLDQGEVLAVVGPSGSGKSTLLRLVAGLDRPTAGSLVAFGLPLESAAPGRLSRYRTEDVAIVEQHYWRAISPYLPAREAIAQPLALRGVPARERRKRAQEVLEALGLGDRGDARPIELSGGEQQRIAFGVALAIRPRLLLADEPTGELDASTAIALLEAVRELVRAEGTSCLIVTHDELVERVADRVVFLHDGRTIAERRGGRVLRVVDFAGWQAPDVPDPPLPPVAAERAADAAGAAAVVFDRVSRTYGAGRRRVAAVTDVNATFASGRFHVVTGPSGSGKSTLLRLIAGLDRPTSGRVLTLGEDLAALDRTSLARLRASRIGVVGQSARLVPFLSALENVELGLDLRGSATTRAGAGPTAPAGAGSTALAGAGSTALAAAGSTARATARAKARESLAQVGLEGYEDRRPDELSTGERARVAIARALASDPELLLLDEPTAALDRTNARDIVTLLDGLDPSRITVIAATHDRLLESVASDRLDLRELAT